MFVVVIQYLFAKVVVTDYTDVILVVRTWGAYGVITDLRYLAL